jgi:hypothetical protein
MKSSRLAFVGAAAVLLTLVGCTSPASTPAPTQTDGSSSNSATPTVSPTSSATPTAQANDPTPVTIPCKALISAQEMYDFNPNFGLTANYAPASGSLAAQAVADKGIACEWTNQTSGDTIVITVAQLSASATTTLKNQLVSSSNSVPTYGVEGYFLATGGVGTAQVFPGPYWVTATSSAFFEPGDAAQLVKDAIAALS